MLRNMISHFSTFSPGLSPRVFQPGGEAAAHGVFATTSRLDEMEQVFGAAGLGARAREAESAEGLAADQGTGDAAIEIEVADAELPPRRLQVGGPAAEQRRRSACRKWNWRWPGPR